MSEPHEDWQLACRSHIGRRRSVADTLPVDRARLMALCLGRVPSLKDGDPLPPLWHWIYFTEEVPNADLGADGHEKLGRFLPPIRYPRRMWAGGDVRIKSPLTLGRTAEKTSIVEGIDFKQGSSGPLCFVTIRHRITQGNVEKLDEIQTIVYRDKGSSPAPEPATAHAENPPRNAVTISRLQLFRYSALTFNAHRIHYDETFAVQEEGYPGLLVHGPLLATLLTDRAKSLVPDRQPARFNYRALQPVFENEAFLVEGRETEDGAALRIVKPQLGPAMRATIEWA